MGMVGLIFIVLISSLPPGWTLRIEISTIRSVEMLVPVASRSKNATGVFKFKFMKGSFFTNIRLYRARNKERRDQEENDNSDQATKVLCLKKRKHKLKSVN